MAASESGNQSGLTAFFSDPSTSSTLSPIATRRCIIIGAGPAGLTAAYELSKAGIPALVLEADDIVGGIARTASYKGYRFDIGGHRFFTKVDVVRELWFEVLGDDFLVRPRLSRIYYQDKFFDYPLKPVNALFGLGVLESIRVGTSYIAARLFPYPEEKNLEQWVSNRFGRRLFEIFFKTYTEKVWGIPCSEIGADWAAQRIKNLDLVAAVKNALLGARSGSGHVITTLIEQFHYPRQGPGMMWEKLRTTLESKGYSTRINAPVATLHHDGTKITSVVVKGKEGVSSIETGSDFISSMPIRDLVGALEPPAPKEIQQAAQRLKYRDFLTIVLIVKRAELFPDNWIYIHSPKVKLGRIQNFKNWSPEMVPDPAMSSLGLEYFVQENDELWSASDDELVKLGTRECAELGLVKPEDVIDGTVVRIPKAYPVYDGDYAQALRRIRDYLATFSNLQLVGRNGQHRYNNQDHSMLTAMFAAQNLTGARLDVWDVNVDDEYHEVVEKKVERRGDRLVPQRVTAAIDEELIQTVFARYDPIALGVSLALVMGAAIFVATAFLVVKSGERVGPTLALLSNYLLGYTVTWTGAMVAFFEVALGGFAFGYILARLINFVVALHEAGFRRKLEMDRMLDPLEGGIQ